MNNQLINHYETGALFSLPEAEQERIGNVSTLQSCVKNDHFFVPGAPHQFVYLIRSGRVKVASFSDDGKEIIKEILYPGEMFGEEALIGEAFHRDYAVALDDEVKVLEIKAADAVSLMSRNPRLAMHITAKLCQRVRSMEGRLEALLFKNSRTRILEFLKRTAMKDQRRVGAEFLIAPFLTHDDIAKVTDTSRQTVTQVLNELKKSNLIYFDRKRLLIRDLEKLV